MEELLGDNLTISWREILLRENTMEVLCDYISAESTDRVLRETERQGERERRLPGQSTVWLVIGLGVWATESTGSVWRKVSGTLKSLLWVGFGWSLPVRSAYAQARARLGARPMAKLFREVSRPVTTEETPGAFYRGFRLFAIDGVTLDVPDTPGNAKAFGRPTTKRRGQKVPGAFPQIHLTLLEETGSHIITELVIKRAKASEVPCAMHLTQHIAEQTLTMFDRLFYSYRLIRWFVEARNRHLLLRVPAHASLKPVRHLADGSYLAYVQPPPELKRKGALPILVRVIEYTLDDPNRQVGLGQRHRLLTDLLDPDRFPARELIVLYHERWEMEIGNDEFKTHQLARDVHLRSKTPAGVIQEVYGILLAYNAIRYHMHEAAAQVGIDPRRISFTHAVRVIRETIPTMEILPQPLRPVFHQFLLAQIREEILPPRDNRSNPRVVKKKMSNFAKKRAEHYHVRQPQRSFRDSIILLN